MSATHLGVGLFLVAENMLRSKFFAQSETVRFANIFRRIGTASFLPSFSLLSMMLAPITQEISSVSLPTSVVEFDSPEIFPV